MLSTSDGLRSSGRSIDNREYKLFNTRTKALGFLVDGNAIPEVSFDVGEFYAGNLPNTSSGISSLFFWFFLSENAATPGEVFSQM
ncbi:hypothetical protein AJ80_09023 [Polytolypa hystricis UAMH7299]|uniref:Uncharacterized protein n=1 Tax=Polytolypa hystricis (strain UAMH7299) TaxID=1447883 RepID=A0A2B7WXN8_POLH7|nr:hypothetical protein AJ80_09023 [Polytolypa hystricis UAMH7299]